MTAGTALLDHIVCTDGQITVAALASVMSEKPTARRGVRTQDAVAPASPAGRRLSPRFIDQEAFCVHYAGLGNRPMLPSRRPRRATPAMPKLPTDAAGTTPGTGDRDGPLPPLLLCQRSTYPPSSFRAPPSASCRSTPPARPFHIGVPQADYVELEGAPRGLPRTRADEVTKELLAFILK
jgi:hypothetical protein